jgi:DnaB-like helicase C terminal domain
MGNFLNWYELWEKASEKRKNIDPTTICSFGIKPLDDALIGIMKRDFIILGADSGVGKSEICLKVALHNAMNGRKVALYFLEGGGEEAIHRLQWQLMCDRYYAAGQSGIEMDYRKWRMNMIKDEEILILEQECLRFLYNEIGDKLKIYSFDSNFTINDLENSLGTFLKPPSEEQRDDLLSYKMDVDLIIIDHLQYFTLLTNDEFGETGNILKKINDITIHHEIPVILVSHLRKKNKDRGLPSQEDFHGTSNISKISSISITISAGKMDKSQPYIYPTYFRFVKTRTKISPNLTMSCNYEIMKGTYQDKYEVYYVQNDQPVGDALLNHQLPSWAKGARINAS